MKKSGGLSDKDKISITVVLCVLSIVVSVVGGALSARQREDVPEVEIIEISETEGTVLTDGGMMTGTEGYTDKISGKININTADAEELDRLKGIGEKTAEAIIEYREETPFKSIEDIMNVKGIGEKKFEEIKNDICV